MIKLYAFTLDSEAIVGTVDEFLMCILALL